MVEPVGVKCSDPLVGVRPTLLPQMLQPKKPEYSSDGHHGGELVITDSPSAQLEALLVGEECEPRYPCTMTFDDSDIPGFWHSQRTRDDTLPPFRYPSGSIAYPCTNVLSLLTTHIVPATITYGFAAKNPMKNCVCKS